MRLHRYFLLFLIFALPLSLFGNKERKKQIVFIVNPISHELKGVDLQQMIEKNLDHNQFEYKIVYTQYAQHATQLAHEALDNTDIIAAVGGDGTVNEVGKALVNKQAILAIIPVGSGNGLARHLGIPVGLPQAIFALNHAHPIGIDTAKMNDKTFLGVAGLGFDAHIAHQFAHFGKRGFLSYCQLALREFAGYKSQSYRITIDGQQIVRKAFLISFANSSQYGNDCIIAPQANLQDGFLDLVIVDDISIFAIPRFIYQLKKGTLDHSSHFEMHRFKELTIQKPTLKVHLDGEPLQFQNEIHITIQPRSLQVMVPSNESLF